MLNASKEKIKTTKILIALAGIIFVIAAILLAVNYNNQNSEIELLQGRWVSVDDQNSVIQFSGSTVTEYYQNEKVSAGDFAVKNSARLVETINGEEFEYAIAELNSTDLILSYLARGNTLKYKKEETSK